MIARPDWLVQSNRPRPVKHPADGNRKWLRNAAIAFFILALAALSLFIAVNRARAAETPTFQDPLVTGLSGPVIQGIVNVWMSKETDDRGVTQTVCCGSMGDAIKEGDISLLQRYHGEEFPDDTVVCIRGVMHRVVKQRGDSILFSPDAAPLKAVWKRRSDVQWVRVQTYRPSSKYVLPSMGARG